MLAETVVTSSKAVRFMFSSVDADAVCELRGVSDDEKLTAMPVVIL